LINKTDRFVHWSQSIKGNVIG